MTLPRDTQETGCDNAVTLRNSAYFVAFQPYDRTENGTMKTALKCIQDRAFSFNNKRICYVAVTDYFMC